MIDKLVEECTENTDEVKIDNENKHEKECSSCIVYIILFSIFFIISIGIIIINYFVYYKYMSRNKENAPRYDYTYQTTT